MTGRRNGRFAALLICALAGGMLDATQASAELVFSTGFNGSLARDAGTAGTAVFNLPATPGFSFVSDTIGGNADTVLQVDDVGPDSWVSLTGTNILDETTDSWSAVFDLKVNFESGFQSLLSSHDGDQEVFIRADGTIDIGTNGAGPAGTVVDGQWTRIVLTSPANSDAGRVYKDGVEVTAGSPVFDPETIAPIIGLFRDNDGDNVVGSRFANFAIYDEQLDPGQVSALGGATAGVISLNPAPSILTLVVDRDSGNITIENNTPTALMVQGYSIRSAAGALSESAATFLDDGSDPNWMQFTAAGATGDLSEGYLGTASFANGGTVHALGAGSWTKYFDEGDLTFEYLDGTGSLVQGSVAYTGTAQATPFEKGDLDFDGDIDSADWLQYVGGLGADLTSMTVSQAYPNGDLNGDLVNNHADFNEFKSLFENANGVGSFEAMVSSVPEPTSIMLAMFGFVGFLGVAHRRREVDRA